MAVDERLDGYDLTTPANNTPAGSTSIGSDLDDHLRDIKKNIGYAARWVHNPTVSAATTISSTNVHRVMPVKSDAGDVTVTLGTPASAGDGNCVFVLKTVAANQVLVAGLGGGATKTLSISNQAILAICDGTSWFPMLGAGSTVAGSDVDISAATAMSFSATAVDATNDKLLIHDDTDGVNKKINVASIVGAGIPDSPAGTVVKMDVTVLSSTLAITTLFTSPPTSAFETGSSDVIVQMVYKPIGTNRLVVDSVLVAAASSASTPTFGLFRGDDVTAFAVTSQINSPVGQKSLVIRGTYTLTQSATVTLAVRGATNSGTLRINAAVAGGQIVEAQSTLQVTEIKL